MVSLVCAILLSCYAGYFGFSERKLSGDTQEKITAFEAALATGLKTGDFIPAWLLLTRDGLPSRENHQIAGAKFGIAEDQFVKSLSPNRVADYEQSGRYVLLPRPNPSDYQIAEKAWVINTPLAYCVAILKWGTPVLIFGWLVMYLVLLVIELAWYFCLDRLREVSATVRRN